jgi:heme-degrading monooxygenase HmoA
MYIAMNRFKVRRGAEPDFEAVWRNRERHLNEMQGYVDFHLLRGPETDEHTLYASHTVWKTHDDFIAWTKSEQFRKAHGSAGQGKPLFLGHPNFEGFHVVEGIN